MATFRQQELLQEQEDELVELGLSLQPPQPATRGGLIVDDARRPREIAAQDQLPDVEPLGPAGLIIPRSDQKSPFEINAPFSVIPQPEPEKGEGQAPPQAVQQAAAASQGGDAPLGFPGRSSALQIPLPGGTTVQPSQGFVSQAGGVPFSRDPKVAAQIKTLNRLVSTTSESLAGIDRTNNKAGFNKAASTLAQANRMLDRLTGSSAPIPREEAKKVYADGSSYGFIALAGEDGKASKILFANAPGGSTIPTLQDIERMMTQPVQDSLSADLNKKAGLAVERWSVEMKRRGASQDFMNFVGEEIQTTRERTALAGKTNTLVNDPSRDRAVATNAAMKSLFDDYTKDDLKKPETSTVDTKLRKGQIDAMGQTVQDLYNKVKNSPDITGKGSMRAVLVGGLIEGHKETLQSYGKQGAFAAVDAIVNGIDAMRKTNFMSETASTEAQAAMEIESFTNAAVNKIATTSTTMDPVTLVSKIQDAQGDTIDLDSMDRLGSIRMSSRVGRLMSDASEEIKRTLKETNSTARNTTKSQQFHFVTQSMINMIGQEIALAPREERHIYAQLKREMETSLENGNFESKFAHLTGLRDSLHKKYFAGINILQVEQQKNEMDKAKDLANRKSAIARRLNTGQWMEHDNLTGKITWMAGTPAQAARGRKKMLKRKESRAYLEGEFGDVGEVDDLMQKVDKEMQSAERKRVIAGISRSNNLVLQSLPVVNGQPEPTPRPQTTAASTNTPSTVGDVSNEDAIESLRSQASAPLKPGETLESRGLRVDGMIELLSQKTGQTVKELEDSLFATTPKG